MNILFAETDPFLQYIYAAALADAGHTVTKTDDGKELLQLAQNEDFDLIILNVILHTMDGFEVLQQRQKSTKLIKIPAIVLTDLDQKQDRETVTKLGGSGYLVQYETIPSLLVSHVEKILGKTSHISQARKKSKSRVSLSKKELQQYMREIQPFRKMFDLIPTHIVITDAHSNVIYANKSVSDTTGFPIEEIIGRSPADLWGGHMSARYYKELWKTIAKDKRAFFGEITNRTKEGKDIVQMIHISPILNVDGSVRFYLAFEPMIPPGMKSFTDE